MSSRCSTTILVLSAFSLLICPATLAQTPTTAGTRGTTQGQPGSASVPLNLTFIQPAAQMSTGQQTPAPSPRRDPVQEALELSKKGESLLSQDGQASEATIVLQKALCILESRFGLNSIQLGSVLNNLARATELQGKPVEAEPIYRRSLLIYETTLGSTDRETCSIRVNLANLLVQNGKAQEAQVQYEQAVPILEDTLANHPALIQSMESLAALYEKQRSYGQSAELLERVLIQMEISLGKQSPSLVAILKKLSKCYVKQSRPDLAEPKLAQIKAIKELCPGEDNTEVVSAMTDLAAVLLQQGKIQPAQLLYERAIASLDKNTKADRSALIPVLSNLAGIYLAQDKSDAESIYCRVIDMEESIESATFANDLCALAGLYARRRDFTSAEPLLERALTVIGHTTDPGDPRLIVATKQLGIVYEAQGKQLEALALYERTAALTGMSKQSLRSEAIPATDRYVPVSQTETVPGPKTKMQKVTTGMRALLKGVSNSALQAVGLPATGR